MPFRGSSRNTTTEEFSCLSLALLEGCWSIWSYAC